MRQYAIIKTIGAIETVIRRFDSKELAIEFGKEYAADYPDAVVSCEFADFDEVGSFRDNYRRVYKVWTH